MVTDLGVVTVYINRHTRTSEQTCPLRLKHFDMTSRVLCTMPDNVPKATFLLSAEDTAEEAMQDPNYSCR